MFRALVLERGDDGAVTSAIREMDDSALPEGGDVTVCIRYSTLNYKDGLCLTGAGGLVRKYPHIPGVDFSGTVEASADSRFAPGDDVILTGWRVGEVWWGGYASRARVKGDWLVPMPDGLDARLAMGLGTAGFTAMLAIAALEAQGLRPHPGGPPVLVTGAAGGVGSIATMLLSTLGYQVAAVTGRPELESYLRNLGADEIIPRSALDEPSGRPLESESWAGCVDAVGGVMLSRVLAQLKHGAAAAAVGLAGGAALKGTVIPFLLRGVSLLGIDSVMQPTAKRVEMWKRLADTVPLDRLESTMHSARLEDLPALGRSILKGGVRGRVVVDPNE